MLVLELRFIVARAPETSMTVRSYVVSCVCCTDFKTACGKGRGEDMAAQEYTLTFNTNGPELFLGAGRLLPCTALFLLKGLIRNTWENREVHYTPTLPP